MRRVKILLSDLTERGLTRLSLEWIIPLFSLVLLAMIWVTTVYLVNADYDRNRSENIRHNENLVRVFEEHISRTMRAVDQSVLFIKYQYETEGDKMDINRYLAQGVIQSQILVQIAIIGPDGILRLSSVPNFKKMDLSDREHFKVHIANDSGQLFISKPVKGRASNKWSLQLTRRINKPDGSFGGVVVVSVDPFYFTDFYKDVYLGKTGIVSMVGLDGIVRARTGENGTGLGSSIKKGKLFSLWPAHNKGTYEQLSIVDNIKRTYSFRNVDGYPLAVVMGVGEQEAMADFYQRRITYYSIASVVTLLIALAGLLMYQMTLRLKRSMVQAESANRMKSEFLAHMSHELRTPLNGILGSAEFLEATLSDPDDVETAGMIKKSGNHLLSLVNSILDMARIEAGRMPLELSPTRLDELLHDVVELFRPEAEGKGLSLVLDGPQAEANMTCLLDKTKTTQILNNLVNNAIKFTEQGEVRVSAQVKHKQLLIDVQDTGCGIPADQFHLVFEQFRQTDTFLTRSKGGSGLGLALVKELVKLMDGKIEFESRVDVGTVFHICIPLKESNNEQK